MAHPIVVITALGFLVGRDRMKKTDVFFILTYILTSIMIIY